MPSKEKLSGIAFCKFEMRLGSFYVMEFQVLELRLVCCLVR